MIKLIYASTHHNNTEKVVDYLKEKTPGAFEVINILKDKTPNLTGADTIIFASGIYFGSFNKTLVDFINAVALKNKNVIFIYTCGINYKDYSKELTKTIIQKGGKYLGTLHARGYDTYSIFGKLGGIAKNHPNQKELDSIQQKLSNIISK